MEEGIVNPLITLTIRKDTIMIGKEKNPNEDAKEQE
jgi:hypothetical protein